MSQNNGRRGSSHRVTSMIIKFDKKMSFLFLLHSRQAFVFNYTQIYELFVVNHLHHCCWYSMEIRRDLFFSLPLKMRRTRKEKKEKQTGRAKRHSFNDKH